MPARRKAPGKPDLQGEWAMLLFGFLLAVAGLALLDTSSLGWRLAGIVALIWGVGAGVRALAGFIRAARRRE